MGDYAFAEIGSNTYRRTGSVVPDHSGVNFFTEECWSFARAIDVADRP
jgi:hypothetical protein